MEKEFSHRLYNNATTKLGAFFVVVFFAITAALLVFDHLGVGISPVLGMLAYMVLPMLLFLAFLVIPVGMFLEWRRRHIVEELRPPRFPRFDFNQRSQRRALGVFLAIVTVLGILLATVAYTVYEATETVAFCTDICHELMEPEAVTYSHSPHANVACVDCHVGKGATWYVRSKLSGLYEVYATIFKKYPRPLQAPVHNLRPARETCETCHWPAKFVGSYKKDFVYFESDESNTRRETPILINVGGGVSPTGIHWHVDPDHTLKYIATDRQRQDIPYVEVINNKDGTVTTYVDKGSDLDEKTLASMEKRTMDCIDCHNRPTHIFKSPNKALNEAMAKGEISPEIPFIKKIGLEVLDKDYATKDEAFENIEKTARDFYAQKHEAWLSDPKNEVKLEKAITAIEQIYADNNFNYMKSNWKAYPNNIGHFEWKGCFRCHDGDHETVSGEKISRKCNTCHLLITKPLTSSDYSGEFKHPVDIGDAFKTMLCSDCHNAD